jgi:NAD(P)-dependent dehydrogenase (short-subunit alcohol dehydrogenase family)
MDYAAWADAFNVMAMGPFRMVTALLPRFAAGARIMSVSTQMSSSTWRHGGSYIYNSAKSAGNRVMQILAVDLEKRGIAVGYIHPGHVRTDMGGADAPVSPEDSAAGIRAVTAGLTLANTGRFWSWEGGELPL